MLARAQSDREGENKAGKEGREGFPSPAFTCISEYQIRRVTENAKMYLKNLYISPILHVFELRRMRKRVKAIIWRWKHIFRISCNAANTEIM